MLFPPVATDK